MPTPTKLEKFAIQLAEHMPPDEITPMSDATLVNLRRAVHGSQASIDALPAFLAGHGDLTKLGLALGFTLKADWTYPYSDDPRAYREGAESASKALSYLKHVGLDVRRAKALCGIRRPR